MLEIVMSLLLFLGLAPATMPQPLQSVLSQVGVAQYQYATSEPGVAFDCSGLTLYYAQMMGHELPRVSRAQYAALPKVPREEVQPGDLIFFYKPVSHVAIYIGNGAIVHAANKRKDVTIDVVDWSKVTGVARIPQEVPVQ